MLAIPSFTVIFAAENQVSFSDVDPNSIQGKAISILAAAGIVNGNGDGTFAPQRGVTRAELCKMINNIKGYTLQDETAFTDVTPDKWYYTHVKIAKKAGYINGFEDGTFRGDSPVTREQACAIIVRVAGIYDLGIPVTIADPVSPWAEGYVKTIIANRLISLEEGNCFRATQPMTRGELSVPLSNFVKAPTSTPIGGGVSIGGGSGSGSNRPGSGGGSGSGSNRPGSGGGSGSGSNRPGTGSGSGSGGGSGSGTGTGTGSGTGTGTGSGTGTVTPPADDNNKDNEADSSGTVTPPADDTGKDNEADSSGTVTPPADDTNKDNEADSSGNAGDDTTTKPEETFDAAKQAKVIADLITAKTQLENIIFSIDAETASTIRNIITATIQSTLDDAANGEWIYVEGYVNSKYGSKITEARSKYDAMTLEAQGDFISKLEQGVSENARNYLLEIMFGIKNPDSYRP